MKLKALSILFVFLIASCTTQPEIPKVVNVATFTGQQVTGVTVTDQGRIFANFPRWRSGVENSVVEVKAGQSVSYPTKEWNSWEIGDPIQDSLFIAVQSVVAFKDMLYVLDTRNVQFQKVLDHPRLFVFDLSTDQLNTIYYLDSASYRPNSYINDLRVDEKNQKIYFTDSSAPGLVVLDLTDGSSRRVLDGHYSTSSEQDYLTINGKQWSNTVHADGIALDTTNGQLYYHALTGYNLYSITTDALNDFTRSNIGESVKLVGKTAAPDGMIFDAFGNLFYADLENHKIQYRTPGEKTKTLVEGEAIKWADSFSIYDGYLYFTNSRIHEAAGDVSGLDFSINKVKLPQN